MPEKISDRGIVIVNQAVNYLTIGICNAFHEKFENVALITGSVHVQGEELNPGIKITRINKWAERGLWNKLFNYLWGSFRIWFLLMTRYRKYEVIFISLPTMAYLLTLILPHRCSMLVWDVYPDGFKITGMKATHPVYRFWAWANKKVFKKAYRLFTISERMADLLQQYVSREKIMVTPIWSIFQSNNKVPKKDNPFIKEHGLENKFIVQYSGNIGLTHKAELMLELAEKLKDQPGILFQVIGRGPRKIFLEQLVKERNLPNCMFLPFQSDDMFPFSLSAADIGVVILDEVTAKGSVPSKSYNLMSYGIPSLYIAATDSELSDYATKFGHAACFSEKELARATDFILALYNDAALYQFYSAKAEKAAGYFKRNNADQIVATYLQEQ